MKTKLVKRVFMLIVAVIALLSLFVVGASANEEFKSGGFTYIVDGEAAVITSYNGDDAEIIIPASLGGYPVAEIGRNVFFYNSQLKSVTFLSDIEKIGESAFYGCSELKSIKIPDSVKVIGESAFSETGITEVILPESIREIGDSAFSGCLELKTVTILSKLEKIANHAFYRCGQLKKVNIPDTVKVIGESAFGNCFALAEVKLPSGLETIGASAFISCERIKNIVLPENLKEIGDMAFSMTSLEKITVPASVEKLGYGAFESCIKLKSATILAELKKIENNMFYSCNNLNSVKLPSTVKEIGERAFSCCFKLAKFDFPAELEKIGMYAFDNCVALTSIILPDKVKTIGTRAFYSCTALEFVDAGNVAQIGTEAFASSYELKQVVFGSKLKTINKKAFTAPLNIKIEDRIYFCYRGTKEQWKKVTVNNCTYVKDATIHCNYTESHKVGNVTKKSNVESSVVLYEKCTVCDFERVVDYLDQPILFNLSASEYIYDGNVKTPSVSAKDVKGNVLVKGTDYKVTYESGRKNPGKYTVKVDFIGNYIGTKNIYFTIAPKTVTKVTATQSMDAVRLNWSKVTGASGYEIYQYIDKAWKRIATVSSGSTLTYRVSKLKSGTVYKFKVRAYTMDDGIIWGTASDTIAVSTKPAVPAKVSITQTQSAVTLKWGKVTGVNGYAVYQYVSGKWTKVKTITSPSTVTYTIKNLKFDTPLKFKIKAYKTYNGATLWSSATPTVAAVIKPATPAKISVSQTETSITLKWGKVTGANGYAVFRYVSGKWKKVKTITSPSTVSYTVKNLKIGTTHKYKIKAYKKYDGATLWSAATSTITAKTKLVTPKNVSVSQTESAITLKWGKVTGANGYAVFQYISGKWKRVKTITSPSTVSCTVNNPEIGTTYKFRIKAYKKADGKTFWSDATATISVSTKPGTPDNVSVSQTESAITLKWGKVTGVNGYAVFQYISGKWKRVKTITSPSTVSNTVKKLKSGTTYKFRIKAYKKADGKTFWSDATSTISTATKPAKVTPVVKSPSPGQITLTWKAVSGAKLYRVYYKVNDGKYKLYKTYTKPQNLTFKNLKGGDKYTFAVRAGINVTGGTVLSDTSAKSVKVTYRTTRYLNAMKSGTYYTRYKINSVEFAEAIIGNKLYATGYDEYGDQYRMIYNGSQKKWYYIYDQYKVYAVINDSDLPAGSRGNEAIAAIKNQEIPTPYKSTKEEINGQTMFCETLKYNDGDIAYIKYCFSGTTLKRAYLDMDNGLVVEQEYLEFTNKVPDSLFTLPSDYKCAN